ncbi:AbiV family abortive infection protein [Flavobacterium sp. MAH-1]|uniref:AbiV family abortive infection protein n=1 Tax=Flavobacterium agri TaxID=2743471 RepID=A0A7Y8Y569_9FLAO|nr:AbiV family abortive infection protein [Flavobacterium agri]NUY82724.1 AbiV family abortive infection protein [Flavobacterium agri]NYA72747.1 AbiV family abortive infection protein [Flavobacterium agri]
MKDLDLYLQGYYLTIENAKRLRFAAIQSSYKKNFGLACSLNILAAEEGIKAIYILLESLKSAEITTEFKKIFRSHSFKHEKLKQILNNYNTFMERLATKVLSFEELLKLETKLLDKNNADLKNLKKTRKVVNEYNLRKLDVESFNVWLAQANEEKNKGLYVDFTTSNWMAPQSFTKKQFDIEKEYSNKVVQAAEGFEFILNQVREIYSF